MTAPRSSVRFDYLSLHALLLLGYALAGKAFAYLGAAPLYAGEIALLLGSCGFVVSVRRWMALRDWALVPLLLFMGWGAVRTLPDLPGYGELALRDAVIWGYGWFAVLVFTSLATRAFALERMLTMYDRFVRIALVVVPVIWLLSTVLGIVDIQIGGRSNPVLKSGEIMVHGCGILAFLYAFERRIGPQWAILLPVFFVIGMTTRAGLLSVIGTAVVLQILRPVRRRWWVLCSFLAVVLAVLAISDYRFVVPGTSREISFKGLTAGLDSVLRDSGTSSFDGTRRWRLQWWERIADYTFQGDYFWTGKGFGVNLSYDDGYTIESTYALRSPHSIHLTVLARMGVPGLVLWALAQGVWGVGILVGYLRARRARFRPLSNLYLFLLAYWTAFLINASFDVFLEGPMGGIWFWTVYGVGLAAMRIPLRLSPAPAVSAPPASASAWNTNLVAGCPAKC